VNQSIEESVFVYLFVS